MLRMRADRVYFTWIEQHDIGIAADRQRAFLREQPKQFRRGGRRQLDKTVQRNSTRAHTPVVNNSHASFHTWHAVRNLRKIVLPERLLVHVAAMAFFHAV